MSSSNLTSAALASPTHPADTPEAIHPDLVQNYQALRSRAMQTLFDSLDRLCEGTVVVDQNARIVWINARYAARFGVGTPADAIGKEIEEVIPNSLMRQVVTTGEPLLLDVLEASDQFFIVTRLPIKDDEGKTIGALGFALYDQFFPLSPLFSKFMHLKEELANARRSLAEARRTKYSFSNIIGVSTACIDLKRQARRAAQAEAPLLILGETGTGKELLAQAIHAASPRAHRPFIAVNVAAIPETLLETEFVGVAPGAFTGADRKGREGKFSLAEGGTLFLDEIGDMPLQLQTKLLRVLQENEFEAVGSNKMIKVDARIIAATSTDLPELVRAGRFRADLYYRLNVLSVTLPPLRERTQDLQPLCEHILEQIALRSAQLVRDLDPEVYALLAVQSWPGNIRELRNVLEKAVMMSDAIHLGMEDLIRVLPKSAQPVPAIPPASPVSRPAGLPTVIRPYAEAMADFEHQLLQQAMDACHGRVSEAARQLGIGRATLYKKLAALGMAGAE